MLHTKFKLSYMYNYLLTFIHIEYRSYIVCVILVSCNHLTSNIFIGNQEVPSVISDHENQQHYIAVERDKSDLFLFI